MVRGTVTAVGGTSVELLESTNTDVLAWERQGSRSVVETSRALMEGRERGNGGGGKEGKGMMEDGEDGEGGREARRTKVDVAGNRSGADVEPVRVVGSELLAGSGLDNVNPDGDLELTYTVEKREGQCRALSSTSSCRSSRPRQITSNTGHARRLQHHYDDLYTVFSERQSERKSSQQSATKRESQLLFSTLSSKPLRAA